MSTRKSNSAELILHRRAPARYHQPGYLDRSAEADHDVHQPPAEAQITTLYRRGLVLRCMLLLSLASLVVCPPCVRAQTVNEYQVKAVFLYNFAKFVEWPEDPTIPWFCALWVTTPSKALLRTR